MVGSLRFGSGPRVSYIAQTRYRVRGRELVGTKIEQTVRGSKKKKIISPHSLIIVVCHTEWVPFVVGTIAVVGEK